MRTIAQILVAFSEKLNFTVKKLWEKLEANWHKMVGNEWLVTCLDLFCLETERQNMLNLCRTFMSTLNDAKISQVYIDPFVLGCLILQYKHYVFVYSRAANTFVKLNWQLFFSIFKQHEARISYRSSWLVKFAKLRPIADLIT